MALCVYVPLKLKFTKHSLNSNLHNCPPTPPDDNYSYYKLKEAMLGRTSKSHAKLAFGQF